MESKANKSKLVPGGRGNNVERNGKAVVSIKARCNPPQYLPWVSQRGKGIVPHNGQLTIGQDICFKQFYSMCVSGNGRGENSRVYGRKKCQKWSIVNH